MLLLRLTPLLLGALCIAAGLLLPLLSRKRIRHPVYTQATVVSSVRQQVYQNRSVIEAIAPVVRYETERGEITVTAKHFLPEWQYRYRNGDSVRICYDRSRPEHFAFCDSTGSRTGRVLLLTAGIGMMLAYGILWVQYH